MGMQEQYFENNIDAWQPLSEIDSREFKFLFHPGPFSIDRESGYKAIWKILKKRALASGFVIEDDQERAFSETYKIKEYFDTPECDLRKLGLLIRRSTRIEDGAPSYPFSLTAKELRNR